MNENRVFPQVRSTKTLPCIVTMRAIVKRNYWTVLVQYVTSRIICTYVHEIHTEVILLVGFYEYVVPVTW